MADVLDEALEKTEREREASLARARAKLETAEPLTHCIDCGAEIPEARRKAVRGAKRCIGCQEDFEGE